MFRFGVVDRIGKEQATAVISGEAVFIHAQELQSALGEALAGCEHLTIDVGRVQVLDATFQALICSLHRHSELVQKKITLQGVLPGREHRLRYSGFRGCLFRETSERCRIWHEVPGGTDEAALPLER